MKRGLGLTIFTLLAFALFQASMTYAQDSAAAKRLKQIEREWINAFLRRDLRTLKDVLAEDFTYINGAEFLNKSEVIARAEKLNLNNQSVELVTNRVRLYGNAAVSTGRAAVKGQLPDQIKGEANAVSNPSVVNLGKLSRQNKGSQTSGDLKGVPSPLPVPHNLPVTDLQPMAAVVGQYQYTSIFIKQRGKWRLVALHLTHLAPE